MKENFKTTAEAAKILGLRSHTMRREIAEGRGLPHIRKGRRIYIQMQEVEKVLRKQAQEAGIVAREG